MSTPNFYTMRDFSLFANDFCLEGFRCPSCGAIHDEEQEVCPVCGEAVDMESGEYYDDFLAQDVCQWLNEILDEFNQELLFHRVSLRSGYYYGVQFYVKTEHDLTSENYDNDDCHYYFDMCRSAAYRKYAAEIRKINRKLEAIAKENGFVELACVARFSNGEAIFSPVSHQRPRLLAAVRE